MFAATRRWFRRNRTPLAIGVGVVGAGFVVTQYVLAKINDARERMSSERIAKENLRRRFEQNQEDCTFTVLALLPTATTNVLEAMNTEKITYEIQQMKSTAKGTRSIESSLSPPSIADTTITEEEGKSVASLQSESGVHASQVALPSPSAAGEGAQDGGQAAQKSRRTKRQLWDDLTISSITRAFTLIYTLALLTMLTRIQLNLLGRRSYLSSVVSLATGSAQSTINLENNDDDGKEDSEQIYGNDFDTNRKYLTFSWWLLNRGWVELRDRVESAVRDVFGDLSPRDLLSYDRLSQLTIEVRRKVERGEPGDGVKGSRWLSFLVPPVDMEDFVLKESGVLGDSAAATVQPDAPNSSPPTPSSLRRLLDETSDLIESPAFSHVLGLLLDSGFSFLLSSKLGPAAFEFPTTTTTTTFSNPHPTPITVGELEELQATKHILLPKILSVLTRQAHVIGNGIPNEYLQEMERVKDLEAFSAVVYSANWENEILQEAQKVPVPSSGTASTRYSRASGLFIGDESLVVVEPPQAQSSFESAWEKAVGDNMGT